MERRGGGEIDRVEFVVLLSRAYSITPAPHPGPLLAPQRGEGVCSSLAPRLAKKSLAASVWVFMKRTTRQISRHWFRVAALAQRNEFLWYVDWKNRGRKPRSKCIRCRCAGK